MLAHCQFVLGPEVAELETALTAYCGAAHCVSVSSGTDALQIAMMAEGIGPGDAVFLPAFTYTATAEVPLVLGATPVFVDVDPRSFQIDPAALQARIAEVRRAGKLRPRALIGVDLFGQPAEWPALREVAAAANLFTIDDCAQSFGAALHGRKLGAEADVTAVSFFPSKPLGAYGDGGALFTESADRAALYRSLRTHGEGTTRYEVLRTGMNGRLDSMQAAVLLAKLTVFPEELEARERVARYYDARLGNAVRTPYRVPDATSAWAIYAILLTRRAPPATARRRCCVRTACRVRSTIRARCTTSPPTATTTTVRRCRCPRIWRPASWRCRSTPTSPKPPWIRSATRCSPPSRPEPSPSLSRDAGEEQKRNPRGKQPISRTAGEGGARRVSDGRVRATPTSPNLLMPGASVALDQRDRRRRPPTAGRIRSRRLRPGRPGLQDRLRPAPRRFHLVAAHEQRRVAAHRVHQQPLIGIRVAHAERLLEADVEPRRAQPQPARAGLLGHHLQPHALPRAAAG